MTIAEFEMASNLQNDVDAISIHGVLTSVHTVLAVFQMGFDLAHKYHSLPMPVCETDKFCPHYMEKLCF